VREGAYYRHFCGFRQGLCSNKFRLYLSEFRRCTAGCKTEGSATDWR